MRFTDVVVAALTVVVLSNLLRLAERGQLEGWARRLGDVVFRIVNPGAPLVPWPPGHELREDG